MALQSVVKTLRLLWSFSPKLKVSILLTSPTHFQNKSCENFDDYPGLNLRYLSLLDNALKK